MGNLVDMYSAPNCPCTWPHTVSVDMHCGTVNLCCIHSNSVNNTICYNAFKSYLATDHTFVAVSWINCANLYLFPVTLCTFVKETAASNPKFCITIYLIKFQHVTEDSV